MRVGVYLYYYLQFLASCALLVLWWVYMREDDDR